MFLYYKPIMMNLSDLKIQSLCLFESVIHSYDMSSLTVTASAHLYSTFSGRHIRFSRGVKYVLSMMRLCIMVKSRGKSEKNEKNENRGNCQFC